MAELSGVRSVERVASEHGVAPARLRWWRWRLGAGPGSASVAGPRMIEVIARAVPVPSAPDHVGVRILVGEVVLELPVGTAPDYLGRVVAAVRAAC